MFVIFRRVTEQGKPQASKCQQINQLNTALSKLTINPSISDNEPRSDYKEFYGNKY